MLKSKVVALVVFLLSVSNGFCQQVAWQSADYKYRRVVQIRNTSEQPLEAQTVRLDVPLSTLLQAGKLRKDGSDLQLVNAEGALVPIQKVVGDGKDVNKDVIVFSSPALAAKSRVVFYLYYGNDKAPAAPDATAVSPKNPDGLLVTAGAEEKEKNATAANAPRNLDEWKQKHKAEEFAGRVWARVRLDAPKDYAYNVIVDSEINPYAPAREATGTVSRYGLQPKDWPATGNDWGKPLAWIAPLDDSDWLLPGEYSTWTPLPVSQAAQWHSAFFVRPKTEAQSKQVTLHIEFATQPDESFIFHVVDEATDDTGAAVVRMPMQGGLAGLQMVESRTEWANRRRRLTQAAIKDLNLGAPPRLQKLKIGTWAGLATYRWLGGGATRERAEPDFQNFLDLGINSVSAEGVSDNLLRELAPKYGIIDSTLTAWASMWIYTQEASAKQYDFKPGETPDARWKRVFDDYYRKYSERVKTHQPFLFSLAKHYNLGDEIGAETNAQQIRETPNILAYFHQWLQAQKLTPQFFGAQDWSGVLPVDDRAKLHAPDVTEEYERLFYHTRRFIDHYTVIFYRNATAAVEKYFPNAEMITVNYQAGPMQFGFIGNNNDTDRGMLDIFELGRERAFKGVMMEDWVHGWDAGVGREILAAEMMRAAGRKHNDPLASYLVGGEAIRAELFGYLSHGIKENGLFLYGPVGNLGPAWSDWPRALEQTADSTRMIKKFEDEIAAAKVRPTKAALLIATTSDIMQHKGLYFAPERQNLFITLQHSYVPVEIVSEQDIIEDDILKNYSLLYIVDPQVRNVAQKKISDWVKGGGRLWACMGAAEWDEYSQPSGILNEVFGVKSRSMKTQEGGLLIGTGTWTPEVTKYAFREQGKLQTDAPVFGVKADSKIELPVWGAKLDSTLSTAKALGTYEDGKPAILSNTFGKGETMLVGLFVGDAYVRTHYIGEFMKDWVMQPGWKIESGSEARALATGLANRAGITRPVLLSSPGVYTSVMDAPNSSIVFLNNATGLPLPKTTVRLRGMANAKKVESARSGVLPHRIEKGEVVVEIPLENADILRLVH